MVNSDTPELHPRRGAAGWEILAVALLVVLAVLMRLPGLDQEMTGIHAWKNIRHYEFAAEMRRTGNPLFGNLSWTYPEADPRWESRLSEAPLVDWLLIGSFEIFGRAHRTHYVTFLVVAALTHALLYLALRPLLGHILAGTATLMFALTPLSVYFACYSIGENLLYSAQLLFILALVAVARAPTPARVMVLMGVCVYFVLSKLTTGLLFSASGFLLVGGVLAWRGRHRIGELLKQRRRLALIALLFTAPLLLAVIIGLIIYGQIMVAWLQVDRLRFLEAEFYEVMYARWEDGIGLYLMIAAGIALVIYLLLLPLGIVWRWARLAPVELAALCLIFMTAAASAVQAVAMEAHDYYPIIWVIPLIVLALCLPWRLWTRIHPSVGVLALAGLLVGFAADQPSNQDKLRRLQQWETLSDADRDALQRIFADKISTRERYFVIAHAPAYTYHAQVLMVLRWDWQDVLDSLARTPKCEQLLRDLGIEYVIFPWHAIPEQTRAGLRDDPVVDPGPDHWKLGLAHRTRKLGIFKICGGMAAREPLLGVGEVPVADLWHPLGEGFAQPGQVDGRPSFQSGGRDTGALLLGPFAARGDSLIYKMRGGQAPNIRVELQRDGETLYRQLPAYPQTRQLELSAMDMTAAGGHDVYLMLIDAHAEGGALETHGFDLVTYEPLPWQLDDPGVTSRATETPTGDDRERRVAAGGGGVTCRP